MQRLRLIVALVAVLALPAAGATALAACFDEGPHRCCCDGDCPDGSLSMSRTMPCCKPAQAPWTPPDPPAGRAADGAAAALALGLVTAEALPPAVAPSVAMVCQGVPRGGRPVPLFRLHAALLI